MNSISLDDPDFFQKVNSQRPDLFNQEQMATNIEKEKAAKLSSTQDDDRELQNISDLAISLHDDRKLMRLASLVGTDAKTPEINLALYIEELLARKYKEGMDDGQQYVYNECMYYLADTRRKTIPYSWIKMYYKPYVPTEIERLKS